MPDILTEALAFDGLALLVLAAFLAGSVRGFSGFGTALVFVPLAAQVLPPLWTVIVVIVMDLFGPLPNIPRAYRDRHPGDIGRLVAGLVLALPLAPYSGSSDKSSEPIEGSLYQIMSRALRVRST